MKIDEKFSKNQNLTKIFLYFCYLNLDLSNFLNYKYIPCTPIKTLKTAFFRSILNYLTLNYNPNQFLSYEYGHPNPTLLKMSLTNKIIYFLTSSFNLRLLDLHASPFKTFKFSKKVRFPQESFHQINYSSTMPIPIQFFILKPSHQYDQQLKISFNLFN